MGIREKLQERFAREERAVSTSRVGRLWSTGRSAAGLANTFLRRDGAPDPAALGALTARLGELKGVGMKLGQILSFIDPSLPAEAREALAVLQRSAPASPHAAVRATLERELGERAATLLAAMEPAPFSVASIGQVHRARLAGVGDVAVKVRHPGIEAALAADYASALGGVNVANALLFGAAASAKELVDEGRTVMLAECDFAAEAAHQRTFRAWLAGQEAVRVVVPEVVDAWSTSAVLTTRWEPGASLEQFSARGPAQARRDEAGRALFAVMVGGFHELGLLYADPHPGNFAFRDDGVVVYDFGCVRAFSPEQTRSFHAVGEALRSGDRAALLEAGRRFGFGLDGAEREAIFERFARAFFAPMLVRGTTGIAPEAAIEGAALLRDKRALAKLGLPPALLFLLRLRFGLYAVLSALGARADWGALERAHAERARRGPISPGTRAPAPPASASPTA
jgi:predicted unusual protein kinase regulating ubiquinone biosynthesis (AarF/ABC1/UbiB family)